MRHIRVLLALFLFAAVIVLILVTALAWWITPDRVGHRLAEALNTHLALKADFQGPIEIKRLPELRITLPAATLTRSTDGSKAGRFDAAVIALKPWSFFAESPRIDHILIDGLSYNPKPGTPAAQEAVNRLSTTLWDVELMELRNSTIAFDAGVFGPSAAKLSAIQARLENISEKGGAIRLAGMLESASISGSASFAGILRFNEGTGDLLSRIAVDSPAATLDGLLNRRSVHAEVRAKSVTPTGSGWQIESPDARGVFANGPEISAAAPSALLSSEAFASDRLSLTASLNTRNGQFAASGTLKAMQRFHPQNTELSQIDLTTRFTPTNAADEATRHGRKMVPPKSASPARCSARRSPSTLPQSRRKLKTAGSTSMATLRWASFLPKGFRSFPGISNGFRFSISGEIFPSPVLAPSGVFPTFPHTRNSSRAASFFLKGKANGWAAKQTLLPF